MLVRPRIGQSGFRFGVLDAYHRRCVVTDERALPVLDAAHIPGVAEGEQHRLDNGLLLRSDVHRLFDAGYVTVTLGGCCELRGSSTPLRSARNDKKKGGRFAERQREGTAGSCGYRASPRTSRGGSSWSGTGTWCSEGD